MGGWKYKKIQRSDEGETQGKISKQEGIATICNRERQKEGSGPDSTSNKTSKFLVG